MKYKNFMDWWKQNGNPAWHNIEEMCQNAWDSGIEKVCNQTRFELEEENNALRQALELVEWIDWGNYEKCPWCGAIMGEDSFSRPVGHYKDCPRQLALKEASNEPR